jgi:hypothetical protein
VKIIREENLTVQHDKLDRVAELVESGVEIAEAAAEADVDVRAITSLPRLPQRLRLAIESYYATEDLTKAAAIATLMELLDNPESDAKVKVAAAKTLLDNAKPPPSTNLGVMIQAPPERDVEALWKSVEDKDE